MNECVRKCVSGCRGLPKEMEEKGRGGGSYLIWCELKRNQEERGWWVGGRHSVKGQMTLPQALELGLTRGAEPWRRESGQLQYVRAIKEP